MKKRVLALALCLATTLTMFGCGSDKGDTETEATTALRSGQIDIDPDDCVKSLCDYEGIAVSLTQDYTVTDEDVEEQVMTVLENFDLAFQEVTDRTTVQAGDYVKIDYVGYDSTGTAFEGGTSSSSVIMDIDNNYDETNGSNYIDGFCDLLPGASVGDVVSTPVTFPETYSSEELAGQDASFDITVVGIYKKITVDDLTDEMVAENFSDYDLTTKQDLIDYMREYLEYNAENDRYTEIVEACESYLIENCDVEIPSDYLTARLNEYIENFKDQYLDETETLDDYFSAYGYDTDTVTSQWEDSITEQVKLEQIFQVIAEKEDITLDEDGYADFIQSYLDSSSYDYDTEEDVYNAFGNGYADEGEAYARKLYVIRKAIQVVADAASVTEYDASAESTETVETTEQ